MSNNGNTVLNAIQRGKVGGHYPAELHTFALTLHFYSPRAYEYVRGVYKNKLPAASTIRAWYSHTGCSPGFTESALDVLKLKKIILQQKGRQMVACLMVDEMSIRRHVEWDHQNKRYVGVVDCGAGSMQDSEKLPVAKDALVFLLCGVNERWKLPVAYFLVNGINSKERANITKEVLRFLNPSGVIIVALTFDGHAANLAMSSYLGANIFGDNASFDHPIDNHKIYIILDVCHCVKLIRNTLANKSVLYDDMDRPIKWKYLEKLVEHQENMGLHLANKLTKKHLMWGKNIMNVKIAVQSLRESTAIALQQLVNEGVAEFIGAEATIKFILQINNVFDCLNSRSNYAHSYKKPINNRTYVNIFEYFDESFKYIEKIKLNKIENIVSSPNKTGFIGFIIAMKNFKLIYYNYVIKDKYLDYILTYKFSQDHLEVLFSSIRAMGGFNNNPTAKQFASAYKKLLVHNEVKSSAEANCLPQDNTNILTVSSRRTETETDLNTNCDIDYDNIPLSAINSSLTEPVVYVAGFVERKIIKQIKCDTCIELLNRCEPYVSSFISLKSKGNLRFPRKDTVTVCETVHKILYLLKLENKLKSKNAYQIIIYNSFKKLNINSLFLLFNDHIMDCDAMENHKYFLIKLIIESYIKVNLFHIGKEYSLNEHKKYIREKLTKYIHFMGQ